MSEPECLYQDITGLVKSDGTTVCFGPGRLLSVALPSQVIIDPEAYCRPNPDPATCQALLPPPTFLNYGDQLQILPEGDPSAITVTLSNTHPDTTIPPPPGFELDLFSPTAGLIALGLLAARFLRPRLAGPRLRPVRRTFRRDPPLIPPGALYRPPKSEEPLPIPITPEAPPSSEPDTNLVYTTPLPASVQFARDDGPFADINRIYSRERTERTWAALNRGAEFKKRGQQEGWWHV